MDTESDNSHRSVRHSDENTAVPGGEDAAGQVYGALTVPICDKRVQGLDVHVG
jgi:hypothetical protein